MRAAGVLLSTFFGIGLAGGCMAKPDSGVPQYELAIGMHSVHAKDAGCCQMLTRAEPGAPEAAERLHLPLQDWSGAGQHSETSQASDRALDRILMALICLGLIAFQLMRAHRGMRTRVASYEP